MNFLTRNNWKWLIFACFLALWAFPLISLGQSWDGITGAEPYCPPHAFILEWPDAVKISTPTTRSLETDQTRNNVGVSIELLQNDEVLLRSNQKTRQYEFSDVWVYQLEVTITANETCTYELAQVIRAYTTIYTYIWPKSDEISFANDGITDSGVFLKELIVGDDSLWVIDQQMSAFFADSAYYVQHADWLLIDNTVLGSFLEHTTKLKQFLEIDLAQSNIYVFADISQSAFRRMTARYRELAWIDTMYVVEKKFMWSFLTPFLLWRSVESLDFVKAFSTSLEDSSKWLPFSYLVDYLLQAWFPIDTLIMILVLIFLALVISFAAQVVWLNVFGWFHPLLFGISLYLLWPWLTLVFFVSVFITLLCIKRFTQRIYLLYSAKVALSIVVYCIITLFCLAIEKISWYQVVDYSMLQVPMILFPFVFLLLVGKTVFTDKFFQFNKWWRQIIIEFVIMSLIVYWGLQWKWLQNVLLWYPELVVIIFIATIIVGRFTWLQVFEYVRFFPLIREYFEEEEE